MDANRLNKILTDFFKLQPEIVAAYLYGSYAKGTSRPQSDIDLAILLDNKTTKESENIRGEMHLEVSRLLRKDPHLVVLNLSALELVRQVLSSGTLLCVNDQKVHEEFKYKAILYIAEFGYYRRNFQHAVIRQVSGGVSRD